MVTFNDQSKSYNYANDSPYEKTFCVGDNGDADLGNFLSRPIKIDDIEWDVGTRAFKTINPWRLFFTNPRVINRVANFNLLKCKLKVKVVVNGNGFYYGRAIMSYLPYADDDDFTVDRAFFQEDVIGASQRPHIYIDPTLSQGGELTLPFFNYFNAISVPLGAWTGMGELRLMTLNSLAHANSGTTPVTISIFAWAEEVELSMPTSAEPIGMTPQSGVAGKEDDEYGKGPVSRPASAVAAMAGKLTNVPYIGAYARATELAANAVSGVATAFGYSRPNNISDVQHYRPAVAANIANTNVGDTAHKLSVDCKQELTVDPTTVGLMEDDEMSLKSIVTRESYLTTFPWSISRPAEDLLFEIGVTPALWRPVTSAPVTEIHTTPSGLAAVPFCSWQGSMEYRFQIVASNFHKGRIKIVYDPHDFDSNEYNTNYTYIHDIADNKDFTVRIGWGNHQPYLTLAMPGRYADGQITHEDIPPFANGNANLTSGSKYNGMLRVYVVNPLVLPATGAAGLTEINVFTKAGEDMRYRNPDNVIDQYSYFPGFNVAPLDDDDECASLDKQMGTEDEVTDLIAQLKLAQSGCRASNTTYRRINTTGYDQSLSCEDIDYLLKLPIGEFNDLVDKTKEVLDLRPQSGVEDEHADTEGTAEPSKPIETEIAASMATPLQEGGEYDLVFYGENITSFRQLLKRYNYHSTAPIAGDTPSGTYIWNLTYLAFPYHRGYAPGGIYPVTLPFPGEANICKMTLMNLLTPCYTGWRGGIKWKFVHSNPANFPSTSQFLAQRQYGITSYSNEVTDAIAATAGEAAAIFTDNTTSCAAGASLAHTKIIPSVEVEVPYQDPSRFTIAKQSDWTSIRFEKTSAVTTGLLLPTSNGSIQKIDTFVAAGEDFQLFFFTGAPILYRVTTSPT